MTETNMIAKLEAALPSLSKANRRLCSYILADTETAMHLSSREIATRCDVSDATVTRFARRMGTSGFREFKLILSASLAAAPDSAAVNVAEIMPTDDAKTVHEKLLSFTVSSLGKTAEILDYDELERAVDLIHETHVTGGRIYLNGMGASGTLVNTMRVKFMRLDIPCIYFPDNHLQLESNLNMRRGDLVICFTTLGKSVEIHQALDIAAERGARSIVITQSGNRELLQNATCHLFTYGVEDNLRLASQTSLIVQMLLVDTIFYSLALRDLSRVRHSVDASKETFSQLGYYIK